jgi:hypothetical protein
VLDEEVDEEVDVASEPVLVPFAPPVLPVDVALLVSAVLPEDVEVPVSLPSDDVLAGGPAPQAAHTTHTRWGAHAG